MKQETKKGDAGEELIKERLHNNPDCYINVQMNSYEERHFCDMSIQKWNLNRQNIKQLDKNFSLIDVKTYPPLLKYPEYTGINYHHFLEYIQTPDLLVLFVDPQNKLIYGNFIREFQKQYIEGEAIKIITKQKGYDKDDRICFKIDKMKTFNQIFNFSIDRSLLTEQEVNLILEDLKEEKRS